MAGSNHVRSLLRPGVAAVAAAGVIGLLPGVGASAPAEPSAPTPSDATPTVADVQREVVALGRKLEVVTEQYNGAVVALGRAKAAQEAAEARVRKVDATLRAATSETRTMVSATYRAGPLNELTAMMASASPRDYLARLSALDTLSQRRHRTIDALHRAKAQADDANREAARATARASRIASDLKAKKAWIEQRLPQQQALLDSLTAEQRQQALDGTADTRASRDSGRGPAAATTSAPSVQASGKAKIAVDAALSKLGAPYVWAAAGPDTFDCSGLTMWAWAQAGVQLPHYTGDQIQMGTRVDRSQLQPGDLVFFYEDVSHVGMYIGDGKIVHAPQPGDVVKISNVDDFPFAGATRVG
jgi:peptidoglycan DL-endopeptidase CwlO